MRKATLEDLSLVSLNMYDFHLFSFEELKIVLKIHLHYFVVSLLFRFPYHCILAKDRLDIQQYGMVFLVVVINVVLWTLA